MANWIEPIFDRTQEDVDFAIKTITEWLKDNSQVPYDLKGCLNVSDINRIENDIEYLSTRLNELYYINGASSRQWDIVKLPTVGDTERILNNVRLIIEAYNKPDNAPDVPTNMMKYDNINDIEKNLYLIKEMLDIMISLFKSSGTFQCGSTVFLPRRR